MEYCTLTTLCEALIVSSGYGMALKAAKHIGLEPKHQ